MGSGGLFEKDTLCWKGDLFHHRPSLLGSHAECPWSHALGSPKPGPAHWISFCLPLWPQKACASWLAAALLQCALNAWPLSCVCFLLAWPSTRVLRSAFQKASAEVDWIPGGPAGWACGVESYTCFRASALALPHDGERAGWATQSAVPGGFLTNLRVFSPSWTVNSLHGRL